MMIAVFTAGNDKVKMIHKNSLVFTDFRLVKYGEKNKSGINNNIGSPTSG